MTKEKLIGQATPEQIKEWKEKHGEVYSLKTEADDNGERHVCYVKVPNRKVLGAAGETSRNNPIKYSEIVLRQCWLGGSEAIKERDELFLSVSNKMADLIQVGEAELEKL
jgi:hypothetical protein